MRHPQFSSLSRRAFLAGSALLLPWRVGRAEARSAQADWPFFINVNLQGMEGGSKLPGRAGTDYFVPTLADFHYLADRTSGPARVPFSWERLQPELGGPLDRVYLAEIRSVADAAAKLNQAVLIDCHNYMHRLVGGTDRYVDGKDGVLTRDHLADLWSKLASSLRDHPGIAGWDIMNEPQGLTDGQDLAAIMRASVAAIDAVETSKIILIEGNNYSSAARWRASNRGYPIEDRHDRLVYSAHCYADHDASGTHFDYASLAAHGIPNTVLADRSADFARWCQENDVRGHIGETNVGIDDPGWLDVLSKGLDFWKSAGLPVNLWLYAANFGPNPFNLFPDAGHDAPQWVAIERARNR